MKKPQINSDLDDGPSRGARTTREARLGPQQAHNAASGSSRPVQGSPASSSQDGRASPASFDRNQNRRRSRISLFNRPAPSVDLAQEIVHEPGLRAESRIRDASNARRDVRRSSTSAGAAPIYPGEPQSSSQVLDLEHEMAPLPPPVTEKARPSRSEPATQTGQPDGSSQSRQLPPPSVDLDSEFTPRSHPPSRSKGDRLTTPMTQAGTSQHDQESHPLTHQNIVLPAYSVTAPSTTSAPTERSSGSDNASTSRLTQERELAEHVFTLNTPGSQQPWLKLMLKSRAVNPKKTPPIYMETELITGEVRLNLEKPDNIKAIIVSVKGIVVDSVMGTRTFLDFPHTLWQSTMGDPRNPDPYQDKYAGKLQGELRFPFSITLPNTLWLTDKQAKSLNLPPDQRLPPSLSGTGWDAFIDYHIVVDVNRNGLFRAGSTLSTLIGYTPRSRPEPASMMRQEAYTKRTMLLSPEIDPAGWKVLPDVDIEGTLFNTRQITVTCSLALATPLTYTRGSIIPCMLFIKSFDQQALDLLSHPLAPVVQMRRRLKTQPNPHNENFAFTEAEESVALSKAVWTTSKESGVVFETYRRTLYGELSLPPYLSPSFTFGNFDLKYVVDMHPFVVTGFVPSSEDRLLRTEVTIMTDYAAGPRPRPYLPPGYTLPQEAFSEEDARRLGSTYGYLPSAGW